MKIQNIALIGFMGVGKSMVAVSLARHLEKKVVSTDELIEQREQRPIAEIFRDSGELYFRKIEKAVIQEVSREQGVIIDCGGGVPLDPQNMENLKQNALVVYLEASPEFLFENLKKSKKRPLLDVPNPLEKIKEFLQKRQAFYRKADWTLDTNQKSVDQICGDILKRLDPKSSGLTGLS